MNVEIQGRIAVVTGAASGIGLEIAGQLARAGARVTLADVDGPAAAHAAAALSAEGLGARGVACDVTHEAEIEAVLAEVVAADGRLDVLVNNAGLQHVAPIEEFPTERFELLLRVMLVAPFLATKHAFPVMKRQRFGRIVNLASINGLVGFAGKSAYNAAKHGLIGLTRAAALEGAPHGITVNALCPGYVDTPLVRNQLADLARTRDVPLERVLEDVIYPLVPLRRLLTTREVADYALFLAGDGAAGITGAAAVIDGGYTAQQRRRGGAFAGEAAFSSWRTRIAGNEVRLYRAHRALRDVLARSTGRALAGASRSSRRATTASSQR